MLKILSAIWGFLSFKSVCEYISCDIRWKDVHFSQIFKSRVQHCKKKFHFLFPLYNTLKDILTTGKIPPFLLLKFPKFISVFSFKNVMLSLNPYLVENIELTYSLIKSWLCYLQYLLFSFMSINFLLWSQHIFVSMFSFKLL